MHDGVLPIGPDRDVANVLAKSLARRGTEIHAEARVGTLEHTEHRRRRAVRDARRARRRSRSTRCWCRSAAARSPRTSAPRRPGSRSTDRGFVEVDTTTMLTSRPGRLRRSATASTTPGLAHVAYAEAIVAVQHFLGENPVPVDYGKVPWVVYTHPEVAWSGHDRGAGQGGRLRRRGAQALVGRQRPGDDPRRDRRPGEDRRRRRTARSSASTWSGRGRASCCTRATSR